MTRESPFSSRAPVAALGAAGEGSHGSGPMDLDLLRGFHALYTELGGDTARLLARGGIDPALLFGAARADSPALPMDRLTRLFSLAARDLACPPFGLLLGQRLETSLLGPISFLMMHSPDVASALEHLFRFIHLRAHGVSVSLQGEGGQAKFLFDSPLIALEGGDHIEDLALANYIGFMRIACGRNWFPAKVLLRHPAPKERAPWRELFGSGVRFGQRSTAMLFPARLLKQPIQTADAGIGETLKHYVLHIEATHQGDLLAQVRHVLPTLLPTGKCSIERVAGLFGLHRRTLHRRLAVGGVTFEQLVDEIRRESAMQLMRDNALPLGRIASQLGYHDLSAFSRAFRRWSGVSPTAWRLHPGGTATGV